MEAERLRKENDRIWIRAMARKYGIDDETVEGIYASLTGKERHRRTVEFFDLYFEGRNNNGN